MGINVKCPKCNAMIPESSITEVKSDLVACPSCKRRMLKRSFIAVGTEVAKPEQRVKPLESAKPEQRVKPLESAKPEQRVKPLESAKGDCTIADCLEYVNANTKCTTCNTSGKLYIALINNKASIVCSSCGSINYQDDDNAMLTFKGVPVWGLLRGTDTKQQTTACDDSVMVRTLIETTCDEIKQMLLDKNRKYGNSALSPLRCFSKADAVEGIKIRIDDKLSRLYNEQNDEDEDVVKDLMGYLILLKIAKTLNK